MSKQFMPEQVIQIIEESSIIEQIANIKIAAKVSSVFDDGLDLSNQETLIYQPRTTETQLCVDIKPRNWIRILKN